MRRAGAALEKTAGDLGRWRTSQDSGLCGVPWGVCPDHGSSLRGSGGRSWCEYPGCGKEWECDRVGSPCIEPVTYLVTDVEGGELLVCGGHALTAMERLEGATLTALRAGRPGRWPQRGRTPRRR